MFIYKITNIKNNKVYIGQSKNFQHRRKGHLHKLRNGVHPNEHLQSAFRLDGETSFTFEILDSATSRKKLNLLEEKWISSFKSLDKRFGYNKQPGGNYLPRTEETKRKISESHRGLRASNETRKKMSESGKGRTQSPEWIRKRSGMNTKKSVLTDTAVHEMRDLKANTSITFIDIAKLYAVSYTTARNAIHRRTWKHI